MSSCKLGRASEVRATEGGGDNSASGATSRCACGEVPPALAGVANCVDGLAPHAAAKRELRQTGMPSHSIYVTTQKSM
jgi:hypothetical protein